MKTRAEKIQETRDLVLNMKGWADPLEQNEVASKLTMLWGEEMKKTMAEIQHNLKKLDEYPSWEKIL